MYVFLAFKQRFYYQQIDCILYLLFLRKISVSFNWTDNCSKKRHIYSKNVKLNNIMENMQIIVATLYSLLSKMQSPWCTSHFTTKLYIISSSTLTMNHTLFALKRSHHWGHLDRYTIFPLNYQWGIFIVQWGNWLESDEPQQNHKSWNLSFLSNCVYHWSNNRNITLVNIRKSHHNLQPY